MTDKRLKPGVLVFEEKASLLVFSGLLAVTVFLFWVTVLPHHLHYQEEIQHFPYTAEHLFHYLCFPGGPASYVAEFLVQFFISSAAGAVILAGLLLSLQLLSWSVMRSISGGSISGASYPLSAVPAVAAWAFYCGSGNLLSAVVALVMILSAWPAVSRIPGQTPVRPIIELISVPLLYYLAGPLVYVYVFLLILDSVRKHTFFRRSVPAIATLVLTLALSVLYFSQIPVRDLLLGVEYSFVRGEYSASWWILLLSIPAVVSTALLFAKKTSRRTKSAFPAIAVSLIVLSCSFFYVRSRCDINLESVYAYDYYALHRDWDSILRMADEKAPATPSEVTCLNLALVMAGKSGDSLLNYFQAGVQGLFPNYDTYIFLKDTGAEALYHAGLLNMALHYSFEAYQTFPGFRESSRHLKRMAELNMIIGNRPIAEKYLRKLSNTLFYGRWADAHLSNPELWKDNPEYARLSGYRNSEADIYDDMYEFPKQMILRSQVGQKGVDDASYHYLLAYDILSKDIGAFSGDFSLVKTEGKIPLLYQQALLIPWMTGGGKVEKPEGRIDPEVMDMAQKFMQDVRDRRPMSYLKSRWGKTVWYYYADQKKN